MKRLICIALVLMLTLCAIACTEAPAQPAAESAPAAGAPAAAADTTEGTPNKIVLWDPDSREDWTNALQKIMDNFTAETGIEVERVLVPYNEIDAKLQAAHAAGAVPDVVVSYHSLHSTWAYQQITMPMDDVLDALGRENFSESSILMSTVDGKAHAVPYLTTPHICYYRSDLYEAKGLKVPTTWAEFESNIKALNNPAEDMYGVMMYNGAQQPYVLIDMMGVNDAYTVDENNNIALNTPETIGALGFVKMMIENSPPDTLAMTQSDARLVFVGGDVDTGHMVDSTSVASAIYAAGLIENYSAFAIPVNQGDRGPMVDFQGLNVCAKSANPEAAKEFIKFFMSYDQYMIFATQTVIGHLPYCSIVYNDEYFNSERIAPFADIFRAALSIKNGCLMGQTFGPNPYSAEISSEGVWGNMITMLAEGSTPEEVALWGQEQCEAIKQDIDNS